MRLPFPERVPLRYAVYFSVLLCTAQLLQGTSVYFSLCCFLFIIIATLTFNLAGGFTRTSGGYVFFYAVLAVIIGLFWKAFIGEPADSNLKQPLLTIEASLGGITAMYAAVAISRKLTTKRALLANMVPDANMMNASIGCLIAGFALEVIGMVVPSQSGSILSALGQLNTFLPLAMILGVIAQIRKSGGTSSVNLPVLLSGGLIFFGGLTSFSKEAMFTPPLCWLIAAASQRYKVSFYQAIGFILATAFMIYYLVPYSQYGRALRAESFTQNVATSFSLLSELDYVHQQDQQVAKSVIEDRVQFYFDTPQGFFDRLQMLSPDDALINVTEENGTFGYGPIIVDFENLVPHFLWPGKPSIGFGNLYAHEIGMIGEEDTTTGISFSPVGEAFHLGRWKGVLVLAPALWIILFTVFDSLCGDVRKYPWGLLAIVIFGHMAPEGMLRGVIYSFGYGALGIFFAAFTASYVMPIVGAIFSAPERGRLRRIAPIRSIPRRLPPVRPSQNSGQ